MSAGILILVTIVIQYLEIEDRAMYLMLLKMKYHLWQCILEKHKRIDLKILLSFVVVVPVSNSPRYGHVALGQSLSLT